MKVLIILLPFFLTPFSFIFSNDADHHKIDNSTVPHLHIKGIISDSASLPKQYFGEKGDAYIIEGVNEGFMWNGDQWVKIVRHLPLDFDSLDDSLLQNLNDGWTIDGQEIYTNNDVAIGTRSWGRKFAVSGPAALNAFLFEDFNKLVGDDDLPLIINGHTLPAHGAAVFPRGIQLGTGDVESDDYEFRFNHPGMMRFYKCNVEVGIPQECFTPQVMSHTDEASTEIVWKKLALDGSYVTGGGAGGYLPIFTGSNYPGNLGSSEINQSWQGNIGIGVENPEAKLDVNGDIKARSIILGSAQEGVPGSLRFNGTEFQGFYGGRWQSLGSSSEGAGGNSMNGAANVIPRFTSRNTIGNSEMTEKDKMIGIGTGNPQDKLHVMGGGIRLQMPGNQKYLRLRTDGSGVDLSAYNAKLFINSQGNAVCINHLDGNVGIGTDNPLQKLDVNGFIRTKLGTGRGNPVHINTKGVLISASSDRRLKEDIEELSDVLGKIKNLRGVSFKWIETEEDIRDIGMIAQEVQIVFPELVHEDEEGFLSVNYPLFTAILLEAIKEQHTELNNMNTRLDSLEDSLSNFISEWKGSESSLRQSNIKDAAFGGKE
jgi:hypothetical protein